MTEGVVYPLDETCIDLVLQGSLCTRPPVSRPESACHPVTQEAAMKLGVLNNKLQICRCQGAGSTVKPSDTSQDHAATG